jgi:hypothetical protein
VAIGARCRMSCTCPPSTSGHRHARRDLWPRPACAISCEAAGLSARSRPCLPRASSHGTPRVVAHHACQPVERVILRASPSTSRVLGRFATTQWTRSRAFSTRRVTIMWGMIAECRVGVCADVLPEFVLCLPETDEMQTSARISAPLVARATQHAILASADRLPSPKRVPTRGGTQNEPATRTHIAFRG